MSVSLIVVVVVVAVVAVWAALTYNKLVKARNQVDNGWSQIDVQLQRRADLVPNLVNTVKGYAEHESKTFEAVIAARNALSGASTPSEAGSADNLLTGALRQVFALSEAYPDLKADASFRQLQQELASTEDRVAYSRAYYNDSVTRYMNATHTFPAVLVASLASFEDRELFDAPPEADVVTTVTF
jgi:LemA protein